jgi:O-antigen ligase
VRDIAPSVDARSDGSSAGGARRYLGTGGALCVAVGLAVAAGVTLGTTDRVSARPFIVAGAVVAGVLLAWLAVTRFWLMLVVLFAARTSLDAFKADAFGSGGLEPGTVVGAVFLVAALVWLVGRWRAGFWTPISRSSKALSAFAAAALASSVGAEMRIHSFQQSSKLVSIAVMLIVLEQLFHDHPERIRPIFAAVLASLAVPAIVAYLQLRGGGERISAGIDLGRVKGTFVHPNSFAVYLGIVMLFCVALLPHVERWWRRPMLCALAIAAPLVLFTYSRGAWVAIMIALLFVGLTQNRILVVALLAGVVIIGFSVPSVSQRLSDLGQSRAQPRARAQPDSFSWRVGYWRDVLPMGVKSPIDGIGFEMVRELRPERLPPHNAFVQAFVETGVVGVVALLAVIAAVWADLRRAARRLRDGFGRGMTVAATAISISVLIQLFSENLLSQPALLWYLVVPIAWVLAVTGATQADNHPSPARRAASQSTA